MDNAEELRKAKIQRMEDAAAVKTPDRIPIGIATTYFPAKYAGVSYEDMWYDNNKYIEVGAKFCRDFNWDAVSFHRSFESVPIGLSLASFDADLAILVAVNSVLGGGASHDILADVYSSNPGRELGKNVESQFVIKNPVMNDDEWDFLIEKPFDFMTGTILPRAYKNLADMGSPTAVGSLIKFGMEVAKFPTFLMEMAGKLKEEAWLPYYYAVAPNPLDFIGAFYRDFDVLSLDLYRHPEKVKKACEGLAPVLAAVGKMTGKISLDVTGSRRVFCPIWYNTYLSPEKFKEFHFPYIKLIVNELVEAGFTPLMSFQGRSDHLLEIYKELPAGKVIMWFDKTDVVKAREVLGDKYCIAGGIPGRLLIGGTPDKVREHTKKLIDNMKTGGTFIVSSEFNGMGDAKVENVKAMTETVMNYGKY
ncbi:MAG: uroporphyrinogen decarboxylase family protein [Candidatus Hermodarchaeota archaeon]